MSSRKIITVVMSMVFIVNLLALFYFVKQRENVLYEITTKINTDVERKGFEVTNKTYISWNKETVSFYIESSEKFAADEITKLFGKDFYNNQKNEYTSYGSVEHYFEPKIFISEPISKDGFYVSEISYSISFYDVIINVLFKVDYYIWIVFSIYITIRIIIWLNERKYSN